MDCELMLGNASAILRIWRYSIGVTVINVSCNANNLLAVLLLDTGDVAPLFFLCHWVESEFVLVSLCDTRRLRSQHT